ncbi:hypothetical protein I79_001901 [Cricetulus griseus]|uniref:Uncharacterized protein n=1 Tax=Cricetulus griseus TaxID=10029 RepID=G3GVZ5_CRIGR|nr:hypothetical protein I79_001901 [Cricetulus griseus]
MNALYWCGFWLTREGSGPLTPLLAHMVTAMCLCREDDFLFVPAYILVLPSYISLPVCLHRHPDLYG